MASTKTKRSLKDSKEKVLSLIICSRNDGYMGNPMWRLATSINYVADQIFALSKEREVEVVVADWGSEIPIAEVVLLTRKAASLTRFVHVKPSLAQEKQQDSAFGEVYALNVAARHSTGLYIGRIDQDTLVAIDFLKCFFKAYEGGGDPGFELDKTYMFAARKQLPYGFVKKEPSLAEIDQWIRKYQGWTFSEELKFCHWASPVGILMMHRDMWDDVGGYDERLIYYWFMDVDLGTRLIKKYPIVNIGKVWGYDFFHLEHIRTGIRFRHSHRKLNPGWSKSFDKPILNPNGADWGLKEHDLKCDELGIEPVMLDTKVEGVQMNRLMLFVTILAGSLRRWTWYQVKYAWYLTKRVRRKPYL